MATRRLVTLLSTLALVSVSLSDCMTIYRAQPTIIENGGWERRGQAFFSTYPTVAETTIPSATITVSSSFDLGQLAGVSIEIHFTQQQPGLSFRPFDLRLDGKAPDKVWIKTGIFSLRDLAPGEEVALSDTDTFRYRFSNIVVLAEAPSTTERKLTLSFERALAANGRTIVVPPLGLDVKWTGTRELPSGGPGNSIDYFLMHL